MAVTVKVTLVKPLIASSLPPCNLRQFLAPNSYNRGVIVRAAQMATATSTKPSKIIDSHLHVWASPQEAADLYPYFPGQEPILSGHVDFLLEKLRKSKRIPRKLISGYQEILIKLISRKTATYQSNPVCNCQQRRHHQEGVVCYGDEAGGDRLGGVVVGDDGYGDDDLADGGGVVVEIVVMVRLGRVGGGEGEIFVFSVGIGKRPRGGFCYE
ncbi:hypothetical protein Acr_00g0031440 [Actinidia rufa]|uniref:Uncharacterized protein n=1 Tax=Actinidia rufa TaxID=165716 RepID=A0A7J0DF48_9ERIC|nr:hypothetical protein Acr_00g0031440 [Actinidia rufa]